MFQITTCCNCSAQHAHWLENAHCGWCHTLMGFHPIGFLLDFDPPEYAYHKGRDR
jgi:hypothetical protein